ncbi:MAG TPA: hypothetical protein VKC11_12085 [Steroidobacteraceae bacterium]|nr:hypothetical protein [Steroidobacteraceae bacterium]
MKKIAGLIQVKESGLGVRNLVVAVFDSDLAIEEIRAQGSVAQLLRGAGRRLGSVLTDENGAFSLSTEDLEFAGNEPRPNLVLMVLAPEDVQDLRRPFPLPTEERILYVSSVPRLDAGAEESYVIRLIQMQVDRFQLSTGPQGRDTNSAIQGLADPIIRAFDLRDGLRTKIEPRLLEEQRRAADARRIAKGKLQNLSALPPHFRDADAQKKALIVRGKLNAADQLPNLQQQAIEEGIARIKKVKVKPMRLRLTQTQVAQLGLGIKKNKISGKVLDTKLSEVLPTVSNILSLVRAREVLAPSPEDLIRKYLMPSSASELKPARAKSRKVRKHA